ncbi:MAG: cyanophycinase [Pseudomonadota bacterium]
MSHDVKGSLVIIGGALRKDNAAVWQRIVELAGGQGASIAVFPSAAGNPERAAALSMQSLNQYGAQAFVLPIAVKLKDSDYQAAANDPALAEKVSAATGVYFVGGDQGRITQALLKPDGSRSLVLDAVWGLYRRGGVIAGSSAGAAIMSAHMFDDARAVLPTLKLGIVEGKEIAQGLGFIGPQVFVDQHVLIRGRFARMLAAMLKKNYRLGLGIDENTALVVTHGSDVEVVGYKGAIVLDLSQATSDSSRKEFNISNASLSYLDSGDRYNFLTKVFIPSADKLDGKLEQGQAHAEGIRFYPDILGNTTLVDLMQTLIDSGQGQAVGLAFGGPEDAMPERGFEFTFSKTADSAGYFSNASGADCYTVMHIRLDVRPVEMQVPLYQYR